MRMTSILLTLGLAACVGDIDGVGTAEEPGSDTEEPVVCEQKRTYMGFGGPLGGDRPPIEPSSDRVRMKPFAALAAEYERALGITDFSTQSYAATFGRAPARWYAEPQASANTVYAAFALAYSACRLKTASGGDYAVAPDATLANRLCNELAHAAWQREPSSDELAACTSYALTKTNPADAPAKRWAYTCAAVLTATGFLTY